MDTRQIFKKKEIDDYDLWLYDGDLKDTIKKFASMQKDSKYLVWARLKELISNFKM